MNKEIMLKAFERLDQYLTEPSEILIGGGAAMLLAYDVPLSTMDIDGLLVQGKITPAELDPLIKKVGKDIGINPHWFNSYFDSYTFTVPADYKKRLKLLYEGKNLKVSALGLEDLLIMKCFAGREKDIGHAKAIIKKGVNLEFVDEHIQSLAEKGLPGAAKALDFLDDIKDQLGV